MSILSDLFDTHYTYDSENRLVSATINGNHEAVYTYNALGLRDSKTTQRGTIYYVYDGTQLVAEVDEDGAVLAYYSHDLDGKLVSVTYGDETYFYHFNHRGDTMYLTDQEGNIAASYTYDAWGNIMSKEGDLANKNPYRYKGRHGYYYDTDTDLYLLNSRWYNSELKRFMTRDNHRGEAADPVSLNRYAYCGNDPINYVDPMGTFRDTVSINGGGGSPKPTVPEPPKPPVKKVEVTPPKPKPATNSQTPSYDAYIDVISSASPPATLSDLTNLRGVGDRALEWYAQKIIEREFEAAWYERALYYAGGSLSALWTSDTWWKTSIVLVGGLAAANILAANSTTLLHTGQYHHVLSNKIMSALASHPILRGIFNRADYIVRAISLEAHRGYQTWHRLYDDTVVQWLYDNPNATPIEFIKLLNKLYSAPEMIGRFGKFIIELLR